MNMKERFENLGPYDPNEFWEGLNHMPLSPPVLKPTDEGKIVKCDGYHRLAVALVSGADVVPFYCNFIHVPEGVELYRSKGQYE